MAARSRQGTYQYCIQVPRPLRQKLEAIIVIVHTKGTARVCPQLLSKCPVSSRHIRPACDFLPSTNDAPCPAAGLLVGKQVERLCATSRYPLRTAYLSNQHSSIKRAPIATRRFGWRRCCPANPDPDSTRGRRRLGEKEDAEAEEATGQARTGQDRPGQAATTSPHTLPLAWWTTSPLRRLELAELCAAVGADSAATRSLASQSQH